MMKRRYGWRPDVPDQRDYAFRIAPPRKYPQTVATAAVYQKFDQENLGSCTGNAGSTAHMIAQHVANPMVPSRMMAYYNARALEGTTRQDAGATIRDVVKAMVKRGVCSEWMWPYKIQKFATRPPAAAYTEALLHQITSYARVPRAIGQFQSALASAYSIVIGFSVYESFESRQVSRDGLMPMPGPSETLLGGHAVTIIGYTGKRVALPSGQVWPAHTFLVQNSWGTAWGFRGKYAGCFAMPYDVIESPDLSDDFWTMRQVEV
jgi:C1A family cysteine protease